jgi:hypothetical protein
MRIKTELLCKLLTKKNAKYKCDDTLNGPMEETSIVPFQLAGQE